MYIILKIAMLSTGSLIVLFILTKLMGNKELSQLNMFDYVVGITIGSIAAEMSTSLEDNFLEPLIAMLMYGILTLIIYFFTNRFVNFRRFVNGKAIILFDNSKFYMDNFKRAKLDMNDFLTQCRVNGFFNLSDIQTAILEVNGKISFLPVSNKRPITPEDLNIDVDPERKIINIIIDGVILERNLRASGNNLTWLNNELNKQGIHSIKKIFLATCDKNNNLSVYLKYNMNKTGDYFA